MVVSCSRGQTRAPTWHRADNSQNRAHPPRLGVGDRCVVKSSRKNGSRAGSAGDPRARQHTPRSAYGAQRQRTSSSMADEKMRTSPTACGEVFFPLGSSAVPQDEASSSADLRAVDGYGDPKVVVTHSRLATPLGLAADELGVGVNLHQRSTPGARRRIAFTPLTSRTGSAQRPCSRNDGSWRRRPWRAMHGDAPRTALTGRLKAWPGVRLTHPHETYRSEVTNRAHRAPRPARSPAPSVLEVGSSRRWSPRTDRALSCSARNPPRNPPLPWRRPASATPQESVRQSCRRSGSPHRKRVAAARSVAGSTAPVVRPHRVTRATLESKTDAQRLGQLDDLGAANRDAQMSGRKRRELARPNRQSRGWRNWT